MENETIYKIASIASNSILIVAILFLSIHLIAPLVGGKLLINALIQYASWAGIALAMKVALKRVQKGLSLRLQEFSIICFMVIVNLWIWFAYPLNLILSIMCVLCLVYSYKAQKKKK